MAELQERMSSEEFVEWVIYLDRDMNVPSRSDHYLMQVAAQVMRGQVKNPNSVDTSDFRLNFKLASEVRAKVVSVAQSKQFWFGLTAATGRKKPRKKKREVKRGAASRV